MIRMTIAIAAIAVCLSAAATASAPKPVSQAAIARAITARFAPAGQAARALCVADRESDGTPHHYSPAGVNGDQDGLFQIDGPTWDPARNPRALPIVGPIDWRRIFEPAYNAMVAFRIWRHSGWLPAWTADKWACGL